jgi:Flp pilus assembly protein TadG
MQPGRRDWLELESDRSGAALLELTVVLPVVMAIGFGAIEFGNLIYKDHLLWNGVRDGARYYAGLNYDPSNTTQTTANETKTKNIAVTGVTSGGTARVAGWTTGNVTITYSTAANGSTSCGTEKCYRGADTITMVTVSTSYTYSSLGFMDFLGLGSSKTLTASHQERVIGNR